MAIRLAFVTAFGGTLVTSKTLVASSTAPNRRSRIPHSWPSIH